MDRTLSIAACSIDSTLPTTTTTTTTKPFQCQSIHDMTRLRRYRQQRVGQGLARNRLYHHNNNNNKPSYHQYHGGISQSDRYLTGESSQYSNCCFLDGFRLVLAASVQGHVDIVRLPTTKQQQQATTEIIPVAKGLRLSSTTTSSQDGSYDISARYKLKSLQRGAAFCVGSPSGTLSIFATERAATWALPTDWNRRLVQQEESNTNTNTNNVWRLPFITRTWQTRALQQHQQQQQQQHHDNPNTNTWSIQPQADALWDIREHASGLLAVQAKPNWHGCARRVRVLDSRTLSSSGTVQQQQQKKNGMVGTLDWNQQQKQQRKQEGITAVCLASEYALLTAQARCSNNNNNNNTPKVIDNVLCLWDLRKWDEPVWETPVQSPFPWSTASSVVVDPQYYFVSCLTPSLNGSGQVMMTFSSHQNRSTVQHVWFDLGRRTVRTMSSHDNNTNTTNMESSYVQQRNRSTTVFAVNPAHDFMACYDSSEGRRSDDVVRLFDLSRFSREDDTTTRRNESSAKHSSTIIMSRKRVNSHIQQQQDANNKRQTVSHRINGRTNHTTGDDDDDDTVSSSDEHSSDDDDSARSESDGGPFHYRGIRCTATLRPKLCDRHGLSTKLSCLAVNDTGTAIVGGSDDGDIFAWTGG